MNTLAQRLIPAAAFALLSLAVHADPAAYPTPGTQAPVSSFVASSSGQLTAYYTGVAGSLTNLIGLRLNGVDGPVGLPNHGSVYGDQFLLGTVSAGDSLVFFIALDGGAARFYSDPSLNSDGVNHAWASAYAGDALVPAGVNVAFEDLDGGGDLNYHDHSFVVEVTAVPEPASWALLLCGAAGLAMLRRRG